MLSPPPRKVPTKGAPKKIKTTPKTTRRIPSSWETIDSQHPESQSSLRKKSSQPKRKGARIGISPVPVPKPSLVSRNYDPSSHMYYMPKFMRPYIEGIVDVIGDGHCGFRAIPNPWVWRKKVMLWYKENLLKSWKSIGTNTSRYMRASPATTTSWMDCILPKMLVVFEGEKNHKKGGLNCVFGNFFFYVLDNCPQVQSLK